MLKDDSNRAFAALGGGLLLIEPHYDKLLNIFVTNNNCRAHSPDGRRVTSKIASFGFPRIIFPLSAQPQNLCFLFLPRAYFAKYQSVTSKKKTRSEITIFCRTLESVSLHFRVAVRFAQCDVNADRPPERRRDEIDMKLQSRPVRLLAAMLMLGACSASLVEESPATNPQIGELPASVASIAEPNQDLRSARLRPEDGCYWYRHTGPVETTLLPLRTVDGRPICTQSAS